MAPRDFALAVGALVFTLALVLLRLAPPAALPIDAPPDRFSAGRALSVLEELLGDGRPHPVGSPANAEVRARIVERLRGLGYAVETQERLVCGGFGACAPITNILARRGGLGERKAVALVAHYDSVPAGPGAADDGAGVASLLEIARLVRAEPPWERPLVFLFTDGEEAGLLGARAFVEHHPWAPEIGAVVNVEARGTRGPSLLFETKGDEAKLIEAFAHHAPRPVTSSLFSAVYERMPNDSDLSVFGRAGIPGVNFAFLGGVAHYHTPQDSLGNLDPGSVQHQGEQALAMARALGEAGEVTGARNRAVYFDLLSLGVVHYPEALALPLAFFAALGMAALLGVVLFRGRGSPGEVARGLLAAWLAPAVACVTALGLSQLLALAGVSRNWVAHPAPLLVAFASAGLLAVTLFATLTKEDAPLATYSGLWLGLSLLGLPVALLFPGASYLLTLPALVAILGAALVSIPRAPRALFVAGLLMPAVTAGLLWFPILAILYDAVGLLSMPALALSVALVTSSLLPFASALAQKRVLPFIAPPTCLAFVGAFATALAPASSATTPERLSLGLHHNADTGSSSWLASPETGRLPGSMRHVTAFGLTQQVSPLPWSSAQAFVAPAHVHRLDAPQVTVRERHQETGLLRLGLHLRATEAGATLILAFPPEAGIRDVRVEGERASLRVDGGWKQLLLRGVPERGIEVELSLSGIARAQVVQSVRGLPPEAASLLASRPDEAVPSQEGDTTFISRRLDL